MGRVDTGIDYIGTSPGASAVVIDVVADSRCCLGNAGDSPGRIRLRDVRVESDDCVLLDVLNLDTQKPRQMTGVIKLGSIMYVHLGRSAEN